MEIQNAVRLKALDLIRGIAILGILPVNMTFFSGPGFDPGPSAETWHGRLVSTVVMLLFEGKMVTLLALLFGAGMALLASRAEAAGKRFRSLLLPADADPFLHWPGTRIVALTHGRPDLICRGGIDSVAAYPPA